MFEGITRITDFCHHPSDVLAGAILGTIIAIIAVRKFEFLRKLIFL